MNAIEVKIYCWVVCEFGWQFRKIISNLEIKKARYFNSVNIYKLVVTWKVQKNC